MIIRYIVAHEDRNVTLYADNIDDARLIAAGLWRSTYEAPLPFNATFAEMEELDSWEEFRTCYTPIDTDGIPCRWLSESIIHTDGTEDMIAIALMDTCHIWTVLPGDSNSRIIMPGVQLANRIGYIFTLHHYDRGDETFIV